jgi:hypothetical protein
MDRHRRLSVCRYCRIFILTACCPCCIHSVVFIAVALAAVAFIAVALVPVMFCCCAMTVSPPMTDNNPNSSAPATNTPAIGTAAITLAVLLPLLLSGPTTPQPTHPTNAPPPPGKRIKRYTSEGKPVYE